MVKALTSGRLWRFSWKSGKALKAVKEGIGVVQQKSTHVQLNF